MKLLGRILFAIPVLLAVLGTVLVKLFNIVFIVIPIVSDFQFGLMTVNALFGGFLYSNYGMLVGLLDNDMIQKLKGTSIMASRNAQVLAGIVYATLSVICGLYITLFGIRNGNTAGWLFCSMVNGEIVFMVAAMVFYLLSLVSMNHLTKALYNTGVRIGKRGIDDLRKNIIESGTKNTEE